MTKRVYIKGAGASCALGLPAMNTLTWELCKFLPEADRKVLEQVIFEIFGARRGCGDKSPNFEELLNCLDPRSLTYLANSGINFPGTGRKLAIEVALQGLRDSIKEKCSSVQYQLGPYDRFVENLYANETIVSFNWDVLLELALLKARKRFYYLPADSTKSHILVLKPHGSINWFALLDRELLKIDTSSNVNVIGGKFGYYLLFLKNPLDPVDMGSSSPFAKNAISKVPAIVPPWSSKLLDVGGETHDGFVDHGHYKALCEVWKLFVESVKVAEDLIVIGYSLPRSDAASIEVMKTFFYHSKRQRVSIIDKNPDILERYRNILHSDAKLVGEDFGEFDWTSLKE